MGIMAANIHAHQDFPTDNMAVNMIAGAVSGLMENCLFYPLDTIKTRMQDLTESTGQSNQGILHTLKDMIKREGGMSLYKGFAIQVLGSAPAHALYFGSYEISKAYLATFIDNNLKFGAAGAVATVAFDGIMIPTETIKQRLQVENSPYKSFMDCAVKLFSSEGIRGFYRSYGTQLIMGIPFQSIHFTTYEIVSRALNPNHEYTPVVHMAAGAAAGGVAAAATTPLDVCKTALNVQKHQSKIVGVKNAVKTVYQVAGLTGFFRGTSARMLFIMPSTAICWATYESMRKLLSLFI